jgi:hypothetical protein
MYKNYMRTALMAAALALVSASSVLAQSSTPTPAATQVAPDPDPCSTIVGTVDGANQSTPSSGFENYGGYYSQPKADPKPQNPISATCGQGRLSIMVGTTPSDQAGYSQSHRHFGHYIMDKIPLTVVLNVDESVEIDFSSLVKQRVLGFNGSDFMLAKQGPGEPPAVQIDGPQIRTREVKNAIGEVVGKQTRKIYVVHLIVQSMVYKPVIPFQLDLRYAFDKAPDGKPNWKTLTTPDFVVSRPNIGDNGEELLEGNLDTKPARISFMTVLMLAMGTFILMLIPGTAFVKYVNRVRPRKVIPANRAAWNVFESQYKDAKANGEYRRKNMRAIVHALRRYLGTLPQFPQLEALTVMEIVARFSDQEKAEQIASVITLCESDLFAADNSAEQENKPSNLSNDQIKEIFEALQNLVPRPWDSK